MKFKTVHRCAFLKVIWIFSTLALWVRLLVGVQFSPHCAPYSISSSFSTTGAATSQRNEMVKHRRLTFLIRSVPGPPCWGMSLKLTGIRRGIGSTGLETETEGLELRTELGRDLNITQLSPCGAIHSAFRSRVTACAHPSTAHRQGEERRYPNPGAIKSEAGNLLPPFGP